MAAAAHNPGLAEALRHWRLEEARRRKVPAFRILTNAALEAISSLTPRDEAALLRVPGVGVRSATVYGKRILELCREST